MVRNLEPYIEPYIEPTPEWNTDAIHLFNGFTYVIKRGGYCLGWMNLGELPSSFKYVSKTFNCSNNQLTTLKGCPIYVGGNFWCERNQLTSLNNCPVYIGNNFICRDNTYKLIPPKEVTIIGELYND